MNRSNVIFTVVAGFLALCSQLALPQVANAQLAQLVNDPRYGFAAIERITGTWADGADDDISRECDGSNTPCSSNSQMLQANLSNLDQYAGAILNSTSQTFSLAAFVPAPNASLAANQASQTAVAQLRDALRACAPEEFSSQRAATTEFSNNQMAALGGRLTALRMGAQGFSIAGMDLLSNPNRMARGGAAGADDAVITHRWGGFINGAYGWGERDTTDLESGFDFDGADITLGVDYRFSSRLVAGGTLGYSDQSVDFVPQVNPTTGNIDSKGLSLNVYGLYEWDGPYVSGSLGWQQLKHDSARRISYQLYTAGGTPFGPPVDESETGSTDSSMITATADFGWPMHSGGFGYEPYLRTEYRDMTIDAFQENSVDNIGGGIGSYGVSVPKRDVKSIIGAAGMKAQYVLTPSFGVITPYLSAEYRNEFHDEALTSRVTYTSAASVSATVASSFDAPSDTPDKSYYVVSAGAAAVFKGGWQTFLQYRKTLALESVTQQSVTVGIRGEF